MREHAEIIPEVPVHVPGSEKSPERMTQAGHTLNGKKPEKVRRTRGVSSPKRSNGHVNGHANGHDRAGSDDARGASAVSAANPPAAGTDRDAYADLAELPHGEEHSRMDGITPRVPSEATAEDNDIGGKLPLPDDPGAFVDEIHSQIDLFERWVGLLKSEDEKIRQRAVERLTDMKYKGAAAVAEEPQQVLIDLLRPNRG